MDFIVYKYDSESMTLTMTIENHRDDSIFVSDEVDLEIYKEGVWTKVLRISDAFSADAMIVSGKNHTTFIQNLKSNYAPLPAGKYRVCKDVYGAGTVCAEFFVD